MKLNKIAALIAIAGLSGSAFATNGDNLIGLGAQSRALGGTGTAAFYGAENTLTNPALLAKMKGAEFSIAGTAFMPDVKASSDIAAPGTMASKSSDADLFGIPEVSLANRINDQWSVGLGMYGTSGMGVDYRGNGGLFNAYSNLQMMKFVPSVAYNGGNFGLGFALAVQYGALDLNYTNAGGTVGNGNSSDFGAGFNLGAYYDVTNNITLGFSYQSEINMKYDGQLTTAANGFGIGPAGMGTITSDKLTQPEEIKLGVAYTTGPWMMTADYKRINWSKAEGYKTFNWEDQDILGLGVKYSGNGWWFGAGYNYGKDPIKVLPNVAGNAAATYSNQAVNMFNNMFFPAIVDSHFTFGGGYNIGKNSAIDVAVVYASKVTKTIDTGTISATMGNGGVPLLGNGISSQTTEHSQTGVSVSVRMNF